MLKYVRPEFFDIFGIVTFGVITYISVRALFFNESVPFWALIFLLIVGVLGLVIDGTIVYRTYLRKGKDAGVSDMPVVK